MISVITPSHRPNGLTVTDQCLKAQSYQDFEWLVCSEEDYGWGSWVPEPPKKEGDLYGMNKAFNALVRAAKGELIVMICDMTWFPSTTLFRAWKHFEDNPMQLIRGQGNQFTRFGRGQMPEDMCWIDPLTMPEPRTQIPPIHMEFRLASMPKTALLAAGGMDEDYDRVPGYSEKELCMRLQTLGYTFLLDRGLEFRFVRHEDHGTEWEQRGAAAVGLLQKHCAELTLGQRQARLSYL